MLELCLLDPRLVPLFTHSDALYDMVSKGRDTFGFVKNTVIHVPGNDTVWKYLQKRMFYAAILHFRPEPRKYKVYGSKNSRDNLGLVKYIVYSISFVKLTYDIVRGFLKKRDIAWFVYPVRCLAMLFAYGAVTMRHIFQTYLFRRRR